MVWELMFYVEEIEWNAYYYGNMPHEYEVCLY